MYNIAIVVTCQVTFIQISIIPDNEKVDFWLIGELIDHPRQYLFHLFIKKCHPKTYHRIWYTLRGKRDSLRKKS